MNDATDDMSLIPYLKEFQENTDLTNKSRHLSFSTCDRKISSSKEKNNKLLL